MKYLPLLLLLTGCALVETRDDVRVHAEHVTISVGVSCPPEPWTHRQTISGKPQPSTTKETR